MLLFAAGWVACLVAGVLRPPTAAGAGPVDFGAAAVAFGLWTFAAYDAWLRARENALGMSTLLPRTPRVAAAADLLWAGLGRLYLGQASGWLTAGVTGLLVALLVTAVSRSPETASGRVALLVGAVALHHLFWAWRSWSWAVARWHTTPEWAARRTLLEEAPFASPRNPSPSLPLATLVAAFIAVLGLGLVQRALREIATPADVAASRPPTATLEAGRFTDDAHGVRLDLPTAGWTFAAGRPPALLGGSRESDGATLSLALAERPLFEAGDVVPAGALERYAARQEEDLRRTLTGFEPIERRAGSFAGGEGVRLVFRAAPAGRPALVGQHYRLSGTRVLVLTLSTPPGTEPAALGRELDILLGGLHLRERQP